MTRDGRRTWLRLRSHVVLVLADATAEVRIALDAADLERFAGEMQDEARRLRGEQRTGPRPIVALRVLPGGRE